MTKPRLAVAGLGRIGKIHLGNLLAMPAVEVVGVSDPDKTAREFALQAGVPVAMDSFERLLDTVETDAVLICSPTDTHADYTVLAAKAGKHIFCEKPLDLSLDRVKAVLREVDAAGVKLMLGFNRRYDLEFRSVRKRVVEGAIGDLRLVKVTSRDPGPPPISYIEKSGGMFLDMTIHDFDMVRFISGKEVKEVFAKGAVTVDPEIGAAGDIDTAVVSLTLEDGTLAVIDNCREASYGYDQRLEVFGSEGMVQAQNRANDLNTVFDAQGVHSALPLHFFLERYEQAYKEEIMAFVNALIKDTPMPVTGIDGLRSLQIGLAALKSLRENRPVKVE